MSKPKVPDRPAGYAVVGIDVGKTNDPTVIAVVHPVEEWSGRTRHIGHEPPWGTCQTCKPELRWRHDVRGMVTIPLGQPYPSQAKRVVDIARGVLDRRAVEWVFVPTDATGVGASFVDSVREEILNRSVERVSVVPVTIGAGEADACKGDFSSGKVWVSATALMSRLKSKAQAGRIRLVDTDETRALLDELRTMEFEQTEGGRLRFGARSGAHDDRVYALAIATVSEAQQVRYFDAW